MNTLTKREQEVTALIAKGLSNKGIANSLGLCEGTIKVYLNRIYRKVGAANRTCLAVLHFDARQEAHHG